VQLPACHAHCCEQVCVSVPQLPHATLRVAPGLQAPSPAHIPAAQVHCAEQVSVSMPQLPHAAMRVELGAHAPWFAHCPGSHAHCAEQVSTSMPQLPHASERVALGAHAPSFMHAPKAPHTPVLSQVRVIVPQLPQPALWIIPAAQPAQPPFWQPDPLQSAHAIAAMPHAPSTLPGMHVSPLQHPEHDAAVQAHLPATHC
jgi:hypothetical protein